MAIPGGQSPGWRLSVPLLEKPKTIMRSKMLFLLFFRRGSFFTHTGVIALGGGCCFGIVFDVSLGAPNARQNDVQVVMPRLLDYEAYFSVMVYKLFVQHNAEVLVGQLHDQLSKRLTVFCALEQHMIGVQDSLIIRFSVHSFAINPD